MIPDPGLFSLNLSATEGRGGRPEDTSACDSALDEPRFLPLWRQ